MILQVTWKKTVAREVLWEKDLFSFLYRRESKNFTVYLTRIYDWPGFCAKQIPNCPYRCHEASPTPMQMQKSRVLTLELQFKTRHIYDHHNVNDGNWDVSRKIKLNSLEVYLSEYCINKTLLYLTFECARCII